MVHFFQMRNCVAISPLSLFLLFAQIHLTTIRHSSRVGGIFMDSTIRHSTPFVGRGDELDLLREQLDLTIHDGPRLVLISAPAGTGKTALVRHFLHTTDSRCTAAAGRGWDNRAAVAYHALREALLQLPRSQEPSPVLIRAFLDGPTDEQRKILAPEALFPALAAYLDGQARNVPLCLFLDDLQWADEGTLEWLDFAFHQMEGIPLLWLGAYRSEEASSLQSLLRRRSQWYVTGRFRECALERLDRGEVEELVRRMVPDARQREGLSNRVWKRSEGLILLAVEEIRCWREGRAETPAGQALIAERLTGLAPADEELLRCAAVIGERFETAPLAAALERDALEVTQRLDRLCQEQALLEEDGPGFCFAHSRYREALLEGMTQALRQSYHARLVQQPQHLRSEERTYHLVYSGDIELGVPALLDEGDRTLMQMDWRDAQRYYVEALRRIQETGVPDAGFFLSIFQRLGDLQLAIGKHVIARTYYEAARCWTRTAEEQILLFCRLAETYRGGTPRQRGCLEEAIRLLPQVQNLNLHNWVTLRRATAAPWLEEEDLPRISQLRRQTRPIEDLPREFFKLLESNSIDDIAVEQGQGGIKCHHEHLETIPADSLMAADHHEHLAAIHKKISGDFGQSLEHIRAARKIYQTLGRTFLWQVTYWNELSILVDSGALQEARAMLRDVEPNSLEEKQFLFLCRTWIHDRPPEGLEWASRAMRGMATFYLQYPTDGGHLGTCHWELGIFERIFREMGEQEAFRQQITDFKEKLTAAGYKTEGIWFLKDRIDLAKIPSAGDLQEWDWQMGQEENGLVFRQNELIFQAAASLRQVPRKTPQIMRKVSGDFILEGTFHAGADVLESILDCRKYKAAGGTAPLASGCGGLRVGRGRFNQLTLHVHSHHPGQVLFDINQEGDRKTLARGLLEDTPVRLRIEKRGSQFRAYASNQGERWYCCGEIDLPDWERVEISVYGEELSELSRNMAERFKTRCWDIGLALTGREIQITQSGQSLYPLPEPIYAPDLPHFVTADAKMKLVLERVRQAAHGSLPLLIQGATGTGKELVARAVHQFGDRSRRPFVPLNCASLSNSLLESELFGHVRGAFTGAYDSRAGFFEVAHGGILFLDEIGDAAPELQARLLRILEEQKVRRLGDDRQRPVDVRIVAATNCDLQRGMADGRFRRDLYYRLQGLELHLPSLCDRQEDIPHLVSHVLRLWSRRRKAPVPGITRDAMEILVGYGWPGNVRELLHAVERAAEEADEGPISPAHLSVQSPESPISPKPSSQDECREILAALRAEGGNVTAAARRLRIHRNTIYRKMRRLGIDPSIEKS
jgi:transcriptional regulator with AAA-type ATPase domain